MIPGGGAKLAMASGVTDPDARALIARMMPRPDGRRQRIIDTTIKDLKTAGIWQVSDALWFLAAHSEQAAIINWKGANFTLEKFGTTPISINRGMQTSASDYFMTTIKAGSPPAGALYSRERLHASAWANTPSDAAGAGYVLGQGNTQFFPSDSTTLFLSIRDSQGQSGASLNNFVGSARPVVRAAETFVQASREALNSPTAGRVNGAILFSTPNDGGRNIGQDEVAIGGLGLANRTIDQPGNRLVRFASFGTALPAQDAAFYNIIRNYLLSVGAIT